MLLLQILARDVQLVRRAVDELLLQHASMLARLLLWCRIVILQLLSRRIARLSTRHDAPISLSSQENILVFVGRHVGVVARRAVMDAFLEFHHALVALLARHELGDHGTVLLIDCRLVSVWASNRVGALVAMVTLRRSCDLGQLDFTTMMAMTAIIVGSHLTLHVVVGQHGMVEGDATLRCVALSFLFVIIYAVDVHDPLVVLP